MAKLLHELYDAQAVATPSAAAVVCYRPPQERIELSYAEVMARSRRIAQGLQGGLRRAADVQLSLAVAAAGARVLAAVHIPRTQEDFLPLLLACSMLGVTVVPMSTDLKAIELQEQRNKLILEDLQPALLVTSLESLAASEAIVEASKSKPVVQLLVEELRETAMEVDSEEKTLIPQEMRDTVPLYFLFTGGTTRTRCVVITHAMFHHESQRYQECAKLHGPARVLANTSVYWGASALGQVSIALAYGGCTVFCTAQEIDEIRQAVVAESVNVIGLVPDQLRLLTASPEVDFPSLWVIFTWGEALPLTVAEPWRRHPHVKIRNLLISTETWLCLYSCPLEEQGRTFQSLQGIEVLVISEEGNEVPEGEVGELVLRGRMVTTGYLDLPSSQSGGSSSAYIQVVGAPEGAPFFRTRDLMRRLPGNKFEYCGRADMSAKERGQWVDLMDLEERVGSIPGVLEAKLQPDPGGGPELLAYVVLEAEASAGEQGTIGSHLVVQAVRQALPRSAHVYILASLPRNAVTQKVNLTELKRMAMPPEGSWPLNPQGPSTPEMQERARDKIERHIKWTIIALASALLYNLRDLMDMVSTRGLSLRNGLGQGFLFMPFMHLSLVHVLDTAQIIDNVLATIPASPWGAILTMLLVRGLSRPGSAAQQTTGVVASAWAAAGAACAWRYCRLFAYPMCFWAGIGHRLDYDCERWLYAAQWWGHAKWQIHRLTTTVEKSTQKLQAAYHAGCSWLKRRRPGGDAIQNNVPQASSGSKDLDGLCHMCGARVVIRWPPPEDLTEMPLPEARGAARDGDGHPVCWACWPSVTAAVVEEALELCRMVLCVADAAPPPGERAQPQEAPLDQVEEPAAATPAGDATSVDDDDEVPRADWTQERFDAWLGRYERWWWYNKQEDEVVVPPEMLARLPRREARSRARPAPEDPEMRRLLAALASVLGESEVDPQDYGLHAMDSLRLALLAARLKTEFGATALRATRVRQAASVEELLEEVRMARAASQDTEDPTCGGGSSSSCNGRADQPHRKKRKREAESRSSYAVFYSPGQQGAAMGGWVLRSSKPVDEGHVAEATRRLVERHEALRTRFTDSQRVLSMMLDTGILFTLTARWLQARGRWGLRLRRLLSWALCRSWPSLSLLPREDLYARHKDSIPFVFYTTSSQDDVERWTKRRRGELAHYQEPIDIALFRLQASLVGLWVYGIHGGSGDFVIAQTSPEMRDADKGVGLMFIDRARKAVGVLAGPSDPLWRSPPYGFPALLFVELASPEAPTTPIAHVWLRLPSARDIHMIWQPLEEGGSSSSKPYWQRYIAFRMPGGSGTITELDYLVVHAMHFIADGQCYEAIVGELLTILGELSKGNEPVLPELPQSLAKLERRLFSGLCAEDERALPELHSLRGSTFWHDMKGYCHAIAVNGVVLSALHRAAELYGTPVDVLLLAFVICSMARTSEMDEVPLTVYSALRDGPGEAGCVGLFADWRDLVIATTEHQTVLGVALEVAYVLRTRRWTLFNALKKPDATIVNFQNFDTAPPSVRAGFSQIGEELWRIGDMLGKHQKRENLEPVHQPFSVVVEQQDVNAWWILLTMSHREYPPAWTRKFVYSYQEAVRALIASPLQKVRLPFPSTVV